MTKMLIIGNNGLLGSQWLTSADFSVLGIDKDDLDITSSSALREYIERERPDIIVNCAAINAVDAIETDAAMREIAQKVNVDAVKELAHIANDIGTMLVHYSSDYVFDGAKGSAYTEDDAPAPCSVYGKFKEESEAAAKLAEKHYIIRLSRLFGNVKEGQGKPTFPDVIANKMKETNEISLVDNEVASITYAPDLVGFTTALLLEDYPFGVYHGANAGEASWLDWGREVAKHTNFSGTIIPVSSDAFPRPAARPAYSVLKNTKGPAVRSWQEAMIEFYE